MDFVAFDFETANSRSDSACQLAAVRIRAGEKVAERSWMIRPPNAYFSRRNIAVHGIRPEDVVDAPTMDRVWPEFVEFIEGNILVAHNAGFDMRVLVASLAAFDIACPHTEFSCTRAIARRAWPGQSRYGLKPLGNWLGIEFRHHDALEDSRCCAEIALAAARTVEADSFSELEKRLRLSRGRYSLGRVSGPRTLSGRARLPMRMHAIADARAAAPALPTAAVAATALPATGPSTAVPSANGFGAVPSAVPAPFSRTPGRMPSRGQIDPSAVLQAAAGSRPLASKRIVCLGTLRGLSQSETQQLIERLGAVCQAQIGADTDYVIACGGLLLDEAQQVITDSQPQETATIRLLSERQFLALLPGGKAAVRW
ncbi:MAG: exonuclease domain-containing protein [Aureliella sp.]